MSDVLVTGATGFLGSVLTRMLVERGERVRIYRRESSSLDLLDRCDRAVEHTIGDLLDPIALADALTGVSRVYHAAARVSFEGSADRAPLMRTNVDGTATIVNAALRAGVDRLVHVSSMAAFGRPDHPDGIIDEDCEWQRSKTNSTYAHSKYLAELEIQRGVAEGLDAVIVNPALMFGVGRPGTNTRRIIDRVRSESLPAIPSGGTNVVDVEDVADGMLRAMHRGTAGERYFLGSENLGWHEILDELAAALGSRPPRLKLSRRPALALAYASEAVAFVTRSKPLITRETARSASRTYRYSNRKAKAELGWEPRSFAETARRISIALQTNGRS